MTGTAVFLGRAGQQLGPYTEADLARMAAAGQIHESDFAWYEGMVQWESAAVVLQGLGITVTPRAAPPIPVPVEDVAPPVAAGPPLFFTASPLKLVLMSLCTLGLYELYWFYRNWVLIKARTGEDLMPFWRAFFAPLWAYSCFKHIHAAAAENGTPAPPPSALLAAAYFILQAMWRLPDAYWLISIFSFVPLLLANTAAIAINRKAAGDGHDNAHFSAWNWVGLVAGGLLFLLAVVGSFLPDTPN